MKKSFFLISIAGIVIAVSGCASKSYVNRQLTGALSAEISNIKSEIQEDIEVIRKGVEANQGEIEVLKTKAQEEREKIDEKLHLVQDAIDRAEEAHKLAKGKLLYEVTISDESVPFAYRKSDLSEDAKAELDIFGKVLVEENNNIFIEIQGYTDNIGSDEYNMKLGEARAASVRNYLHVKHNIPLHRMSTFSYGESKPVAANDTEENRAKNRRVVLMVME